MTQGLAEILRVGLQVEVTGCRVTEAQHSDRCVQAKARQFGPGPFHFELQQVVDKAYRHQQVVKKASHRQTPPFGHHETIPLGNRLEQPEVKLVVDLCHHPVVAAQRVDGRFYGGCFKFILKLKFILKFKLKLVLIRLWDNSLLLRGRNRRVVDRCGVRCAAPQKDRQQS